MKYLKHFTELLKEGIGEYDPMPDTSPKLTDYTQNSPDGMAGSWNSDSDWKKIESPLDNEFKRISKDISDSDKNNNTGIMDIDKIKKKRYHVRIKDKFKGLKVKHIRNK